MASAPSPYHPPTLPSSIHHVALASKSFRVFGLNDPAWKEARVEWRRYNRGVSSRHLSCDDGDGDGGQEDDEEEEMALICNAITTALEEDAGGFGTAGFHVTEVDVLTTTTDSSSSAIYNAKLIPRDVKTLERVDPSNVCSKDEDTGEVKYAGNDEFYVKYDSFQIRITVSKANEGLAAKKYYEALFDKRKEMAAGSESDIDIDDDQWVQEDEQLKELQQKLIDAREGNGDSSALGYYVEVMLLEPHVKIDDVAIPPPEALDRNHPNARPTNNSTPRLEEEQEKSNAGGGGRSSIFQRDIYSSCQFNAPGPWEKANIRAFGDIELDVRKALVRVEFPVFPEGCKDKTFREVYQLNARLKSGSFATVCRGTHRATGKKIAVKCVLRKDLPPSDDASIYDEVLILSTLCHSYICPLIDFFEERECYFLVMELMSGGDLFDRIGKRESYTEDDARAFCRKMLESVRFCHENSVAHCDMKPKNLLLTSDDDDIQMKLCDFGFAHRVYEPRSLTKKCGTPFFVAPEVLIHSPYDQQSDMWGCGVIMFLLLGGELPFMGRSQKELFRNIVMGRYEFEEQGWAHVSEEAKDLVRKLLVTDPAKRLTSREALDSPWMRQRGNMLARNNLQYTSKRLKGFEARTKLKASMLAVKSVVSLQRSLSIKSVVSERSLQPEQASKRPSWLCNLPNEEMNDASFEEED